MPLQHVEKYWSSNLNSVIFQLITFKAEGVKFSIERIKITDNIIANEIVMKSEVMRAGYQTLRSPVFRMLSEDQNRDIHNATLEILGRIVVMSPSPEAVKLLKNAGCKVAKRNGKDVVKIPSRIVLAAGV